MDGGESLSVFAFWSGHDRKITSRAFVGGDVTAVMGGAELDLRGATLVKTTGPAVIDLFVMMGGVDLFVPPEWDVVLEATAIMGAIEDKRRGAPLSRETAETAQTGEAEGAVSARPKLILRGLVLMGGIELKS